MRHLVSFLIVFVFSFHLVKAQNTKLELPKLNLEFASGLNYLPLNGTDGLDIASSDLGDLAYTAGFFLRMEYDMPFEAQMGILETRLANDEESNYFLSISVSLAYRLKIAENWDFVPGLGYQAMRGFYERSTSPSASPGPVILPLGNIRRTEFQQQGLQVMTELRWTIPSAALFPLIPKTLNFRLCYGLPLGDGRFEFAGASPVLISENQVYSQFLSASLGFSYQLVGAKN